MLSVHEWLLLRSAHVALHCIFIVQVLQYVAGNQEALAKDHIWRAERLPRTGGDLDESHTGCSRARKCVRYLHLSQVHHITVEYYLPLRLALLTCLEAAGPQIAVSNAVCERRYCNGQTPAACAASQTSTVASLREVLPPGMPIYLEETGSSAGCYVPFHDTTGEAAFVVPYVAAMHAANLSGAHWWCASDLYTEHGCPPDIAGGKGFTWIRA
jgi:hypothetical protein